jgi:hypothetical protein
MVHPTLAQVIGKIDATIAKYPTITQYGTFFLESSRTEIAVTPVIIRRRRLVIRGTKPTWECTNERGGPTTVDGSTPRAGSKGVAVNIPVLFEEVNCCEPAGGERQEEQEEEPPAPIVAPVFHAFP